MDPGQRVVHPARLSLTTTNHSQHYASMSSGAHRDRVYVRQYRLWGFERWKIPIIIDFLPVLLNIALLLFFAGLAVYIAPLNTPIASAIIGLSAAAFLAYAFTIVLPICAPYCAYKTPVTDYIIVLAHLTHEYLILFPLQLVRFFYDVLRTMALRNRPHRRLPRMPWPAYHYDPSSMTSREQSDIEEREDFLVVEALHWLCTSSSNTSAASVAAQSASALPTNSSSLRSSRWIACRTAERELSALGRRCYMAQSPAVALANVDAIERLTRTVVHFPYELARISGVWGHLALDTPVRRARSDCIANGIGPPAHRPPRARLLARQPPFHSSTCALCGGLHFLREGGFATAPHGMAPARSCASTGHPRRWRSSLARQVA